MVFADVPVQEGAACLLGVRERFKFLLHALRGLIANLEHMAE